MRIDVITLFPGMFDAISSNGITGKAVSTGLLALNLWDLRDYTNNSYRAVDDRPYGGGPGMVLLYKPLRDAIRAVKKEHNGRSKVIYLSPQGKCFNQRMAQDIAEDCDNLVLIAGRYEGIDERIIETEVDEEVSIGDYVLSGGEIAAMVIIDAITRLLPDALGHQESAQQDSFINGILDHPQYSRPELIDGLKVPDILLTGDHQAIRKWRKKQALGKTWLKRPDLLSRLVLDQEQQQYLKEFIVEHDKVNKISH